MKTCHYQYLGFSLYKLNSAEQNTDQIKDYDPKDNHKINQGAETIPNGNADWLKQQQEKLFCLRERVYYFISDKLKIPTERQNLIAKTVNTFIAALLFF